MCLAVPMKVCAVIDSATAAVDMQGVQSNVDISLIDTPQPGDFLIVHAGFAIQKLDEEEAARQIELLKALK